MTSSTTLPLPIPPTGANHHDPATPTSDSRMRSDTILTTSSSSSSFPPLQTPQTPMITSVLGDGNGNGYHTSPKGLAESPTESLSLNPGDRRKNSYGFGESFRTSPPPLSPSYRYRASPSIPRLSPKERAVQLSQEDPDQPMPRPLTPMPVTVNELGDAEPLISSPALVEDDIWGRRVEVFSLSPQDVEGGLQTYVQSREPSHSGSSGVIVPAPPAPKTSSSIIKSAVKKKIERSKSAFAVRRPSANPNNDHADTPSSTGSSETSPVPVAPFAWDVPAINAPVHLTRPKRSRLKSLLTLSRNQSSSSLKTNATLSLAPSPQIGLDQTNVPTSITGRPQTSTTVTGGAEEGTHNSPHPPIHYTRHLSVDGLGPVTRMQLDKGKSRLERSSYMDVVYTAPSSRHLEISQGPVTRRTSRPRALSMPLPATGKLDLLEMLLSGDEELPKPDLFDTMLPHELQVLILQKLLDSHQQHGGNGRWAGETGGRKELIRLSRVSKGWQKLCFDGQLWPLVQLNPFAHLLHYNTFDRIITSSLSFISELNLRGLDGLVGANLVASLTKIDLNGNGKSAQLPISLPRLRSLDLRGCKALDPFDICSIILGSPELRSINLKGVQSVTLEVLRAIGKSCRHLESLDISRCYDVSLGDVAVLIRSMDDRQAARLHTLRVAGTRPGRTSYGHHPSEFLPLLARKTVNLRVLDIQGCPNLDELYFKQYGEMLDSVGRQSSLEHLNLSGCTSVRKHFLAFLRGRCPNLTRLEMASLPDIFSNQPDEDELLVDFLRTTPKLQRLDLEGTGVYGGVTDRVLNTLAIGRDDEGKRYGEELVELRIGFAKNVTSESILRVMRWCTKLEVLEVDNTAADEPILREFHRQHGRPTKLLSAMDCHAITPSTCKSITSVRLREGFAGWHAVPFMYDGTELDAERKVLKTNFGWKDAKPPGDWREVRERKERASADGAGAGAGADEDDELRMGEHCMIASGRSKDRTSCVIM